MFNSSHWLELESGPPALSAHEGKLNGRLNGCGRSSLQAEMQADILGQQLTAGFFVAAGELLVNAWGDADEGFEHGRIEVAAGLLADQQAGHWRSDGR